MTILYRTNDKTCEYSQTDYLVYDVIDKYKTDKLEQYPDKIILEIQEQLYSAIKQVVTEEEKGHKIIPSSQDFQEAISLLNITLSKRGLIL